MYVILKKITVQLPNGWMSTATVIVLDRIAEKFHGNCLFLASCICGILLNCKVNLSFKGLGIRSDSTWKKNVYYLCFVNIFLLLALKS